MQSSTLEPTLFSALERINARPQPFAFYTARELWTDEHTSAQMLKFHLNETVDLASRKSAFVDRSVAWLGRHLGITTGVSVVDFGCGPGLYTARLAQQGATVMGIDFSVRSLAYARDYAKAQGLDIQYTQANYLDFTTEQRFDVILLIFCDFCALSPTQRAQMLQKFRALLRPGGRIVLDVHALPLFDQRVEAASYEANLLHGFWSPEPYYGFLNTFKYEEAKVTLDQYTIVTRTKVTTVYNWLQYFSPASLTQEFQAAGLTITEYYADVAGTPYASDGTEFAVVATSA